MAELNQLELQFLLLNNFTLVIPKDEMQRYAEQLILFSSNNSVLLPSVSSPSSFPSTPRPAGTIPIATSPRHHDMAAPMRSMGAIDAYGGRIPGSELHTPSATGPTVNTGAPMSRQAAHRGMESNALSRVINSHQHHPHHALNGSVNGTGFSSSHSSSSKLRQQEDSESESGEGTGAETETETETETEAETETDGGWTTDDEPTIRPPKSSVGSSSSSSRSSGASDARSICSSTSEGGEGDDESEDPDHIMDDIDEEDSEEGGRTPEHGARVQGGDDREVEVEVAKDAERTPERRPFLSMAKITPPGRQEHGVIPSP